MSGILRGRVRLRRPVEIVALPALARHLAAPGRVRGIRRIRRKLARAAFDLSHRRLGIAATAVLDIAGRRIAVDSRSTTFALYAAALARGGYELELGAFLDLAAPACRTVYDIGANWGHVAVHLATCPGFSGEIHAFEAAPATALLLRDVIERAGFGDRVTVHPFGVSGVDGALPIVSGGHTPLARLDAHASGPKVPVRRLDGLGLPDPDIIKIDVEGHEGEVLAGAAATIERAQPLIVLESWFGSGTLAPLRFLAERGYALYRFAWEDENGLTLDPPQDLATLTLVPLQAEERRSLPWDFNVAAIPAGRSIPGML